MSKFDCCLKLKLCFFLLLIGLGLATPAFGSSHVTMLASDGKTVIVPFNLTIVENPEQIEMETISNKAQTLFQAKDYDGLEGFIQKLRDSKEQFAGGSWKFYFVYCGVGLAQSAPESEWKAHIAALREWVGARPNSITAHVALADALTTYAWKARGNDWADTVTDEGWMLFKQRLNEAVKVLDDAKELKEKCPYWWSVLLTTELGLGTSRAKYDATFEKAIHTWPGYAPFYVRRERYLLPRWYGEEGEWESDLDQSASKIGGDDGDLLYARGVASMQCMNIYDNVFTETAASWARVNRGLEIMEKRFPDSLVAPSEHAHLAVLAGDARTARKYFDELGGRVDLCSWETKAEFVRCAAWAYSN